MKEHGIETQVLSWLGHCMEEPGMTWWIWILAGLALLAVEVAIPGGIIMLFFGVSAMVVGVLVALGIGGPLWFQAVLFSVLSIVSLLTLRGPILRRMSAAARASGKVDSIAGEPAVALEALAAGGSGQVELRGANWTAVNDGEEPLEVGETCRVDRVEGLTLYVRRGGRS